MQKSGNIAQPVAKSVFSHVSRCRMTISSIRSTPASDLAMSTASFKVAATSTATSMILFLPSYSCDYNAANSDRNFYRSECLEGEGLIAPLNALVHATCRVSTCFAGTISIAWRFRLARHSASMFATTPTSRSTGRAVPQGPSRFGITP